MKDIDESGGSKVEENENLEEEKKDEELISRIVNEDVDMTDEEEEE
jgi:hypothetical protein